MGKSGRRYYPEDSFEYLYEIEDIHWWFQARNSLIVWILKYKVRGFKRFLEIGCGTGCVLAAISRAFPNKCLEGGEYYEKGLEVAKRRLSGVNTRLLDATRLNLIEQYDCIGSFDVLEHIHDDSLVLDNIYKSLITGGCLVLTVPQHPWLWSCADIRAEHVRRYTAKELDYKLISAGFRIVYSTSFVSFLLPLMALQRLLPSFISRVQRLLMDSTYTACTETTGFYREDDEFKINTCLNSLLLAVQRFELLMLRSGLRLPFGGSLLVVAQKP
jgi:SAM-dependent methyltransferase